MISRYTEIQEKINESNRRVVRSTLYPPIARSLRDIYIMTTPGDRIDLLAKKYYSDIGYWWIIAEGNAIGKGTMIVPPGLQLRVPMDLATILQDYRELNK
jgi:hypothetical protein